MTVKTMTRGKRRMSTMRRNEAIAGYLFMLPLLLGIVFLTYGQFVYSLIISFTNKSIFAEAKSRGADGMNAAMEKAFQYAEEKLDAIRYDEYETVVFIGKSLGTIVGAKYAAQHNCTPDQVWYTPVPEAYEYVKGNVLAFMGDRDHVMNAEEARKKAAEKNLPLHVYPNADHSLATGNTLTDLDILKDVMTVTGEFLK